MIFRKFIVLTFLSFLVFSCSEDNVDAEVERTNDDYSPTTVGSTWTHYHAIVDYTVTTTIANKTKVLDGKTYFVVNANSFDSPASQELYIRKNGDEYIQREIMDGMYDDKESIYLKDGPVGTKWIEKIFPETEDENVLEFEIIELNGTYTFSEQEFTNVLVLKITNITWEDVDPAFTIGYYAKGVGLIKSEFILDGDITTATELIAYTVH
jgi:hypothetical protein